MDATRSLSCSMILEVLATLCNGPYTFSELSRNCSVQGDYLRIVTSAAVSSGLIEVRSDTYQLTKKGARTAIYLLVVNEWMDFSVGQYQELMRALNRKLAVGAPAA